MNKILLQLLFQTLRQLIGSDRWSFIEGAVSRAEVFLSLGTGEDKKKYVMTELQWLVSDLREGTSSEVLQKIAHILIAIAVDAICAKAKIAKL